MKATRNTQSGLSLLELLISFAILGVASAGLVYTTTMTTTGNQQSEERAAALSLAIDKLEQLQNSSLTDLVAGSYAEATPLAADGSAGGAFTRTWTIADSTVLASEGRTLTVTVSWGDATPVVLSTMIVETAEILTGFEGAFPAVSIRSWSQSG